MKKTISIVLALALGLATEVVKADFIFGKLPNVGAPDGSVQIGTNVLVSSKRGGYVFCNNVEERGSGPSLYSRLQEPFEKGRNHDQQM